MTGRYLPEESRGPEDRLKLRAARINKSIRKVRKGQWAYHCGLCGAQWSGPDQWTVYEFGWNHDRDAAAIHAYTSIQNAMDGIAEAFTTMLKPVNDAIRVLTESSAFAPVPNMPHDPTLLKDKRKWGGK